MREKGTPHSKEQDQPSPGDSKEVTTERYATCWEEISEIELASIQPCPIIPDYKKPTASALPIIVQTPAASFCIDGWHFIEQAKAADRSSIRCHISHIAQHSDTELAIRKFAIRVMPQGGKCSYAESIRNTHHLYQALKETSDDLVLFSHGGDRRGVSFTSSQENNIRVILAIRLGKSQTTINKYLQHGDSLNDAVMGALVDAAAPKLFFEAFQVKKQVEVAALQAEQKNETAIESDISNQVSTWLNEFQRPDPPNVPPQESPQPPQADHSSDAAQSVPSEDHRSTPTQRIPQVGSGTDGIPAIDPAPANPEGVATELKRIGEALIEIAGHQQLTFPKQVETIRKLILELTRLLPRLAHMGAREDGVKGGDV